jgi:hypothetical protein
MLVTDTNWELVAANWDHKQVLFDYAEMSGVPILAVDADEATHRNDDDLAIGYCINEGLLSYTSTEASNSSFTRITPAQFLEMCDAYYHQSNA